MPAILQQAFAIHNLLSKKLILTKGGTLAFLKKHYVNLNHYDPNITCIYINFNLVFALREDHRADRLPSYDFPHRPCRLCTGQVS